VSANGLGRDFAAVVNVAPKMTGAFALAKGCRTSGVGGYAAGDQPPGSKRNSQTGWKGRTREKVQPSARGALWGSP
jgi:hypothetical protein